MKRVQLPFGRRAHQSFLLGSANGPFGRWLAGGACVVGLALVAGLADKWTVISERHQAAQRRLQTVQAAPARSAPSKPRPTENFSTQQLGRLNDLISQLNTPWMDVFEALERGTPAGVALVLVEPDVRKGVVRIQAEATGVDALLSYAEQVSQGPVFSGLSFLQHETNEQDPNRPARLSFELKLGEQRSAVRGLP